MTGLRPDLPADRDDGRFDEEFLFLWMRRRRRDRDEDDEDGRGDGHGDGGGGGQGGTPGPTATPFLVIPANASDVGARPIPVTEATTNFSIQGTNLATGGPFLMQLSCTVVNLGVAVCAAGLAEFYLGDQFWWGNPGHELLTPAQVKANAQLIGVGTFRLPPGGTGTVVCPTIWQVDSQVAGQRGVLVQVYDSLGDRLAAPFDAVTDRHVARFDMALSSWV